MRPEHDPPSWEQYAREVGARLQGARTRAGLTQEQVARSAGISTFTYQKLEKGESNPGTPANPGLYVLVSLAVTLQVNLPDLLPSPTPGMMRREVPPRRRSSPR